ncbi:MAG: MFS transporter [Candidatus Njordarchaeota archaeon]
MEELAHRNRVFLVLYLGTFVFRFAFGLSALLAITILEKMQYGVFAMVIFAIAFSFIEGLFAGVTGYATDILDARIVLLSSSVVASLAMTIYILAYPFVRLELIFLIVLMVGHAIHGIASSLKVTPTIAIISRYTDYKERARFMGLYDMILMYGRISGLAAAGIIYTFFAGGNPGDPPKALFGFVILIAIFLLAGIMFYFGLPHIAPERKGKVEHLWTKLFEHIGAGAKIMFGKLRRDIGLTWFMLSCLWGLAFNLGPYLILRDFGVNPEGTGFITAVITLVIGGTSPFWGLVADKIGRKKTATIGVLGLVFITFLAAFATTELGISYTDVRFYFIIAPGIFCLAAIGPSFLGRLGDTAISGERGIVSSGFQFVTSMGEVTGTAIGGLGYFIGHMMLANTDLAPFAGLIGLGIPGIFFFFATIFFGLRLKHDEAILAEIKRLEEEYAKKAESHEE